MYLIAFPLLAECDTRSVFKCITVDLNSNFSFSLTGSHIKVKDPILPYLPIAGGKEKEMSSCLFQVYFRGNNFV